MNDPKSNEDAGRKEVFKVTINATLDAVWQELVRTDGLQKAMFNSRMHTPGVEVGAPLRMRSPNGRYTAVAGEFLQVERPARLAHTFRFTTYDDPECTVTYDLREVDGGVELTLTVGNMPVGTKTAKQMSQGGTFIVNNVKAIVETGKPTFSARCLFLLFKLLEPFNPKRTLSTEWPL
ncbi:MAG: SRPBCC domain-containing protein [Acidobacteriota bacterium]